jgi:hypothetical protein
MLGKPKKDAGAEKVAQLAAQVVGRARTIADLAHEGGNSGALLTGEAGDIVGTAMRVQELAEAVADTARQSNQ